MDRDAVRALTYNVRRDVASDGEYDWAGRRDAVASTIRFHRPDVVGLQEPLAHQYDDLRAALPAFEWVGESRGGGEREEEFCPVGYRRDRFERVDAGTFWLSPTPDDPGSAGWDASYPRIATWARLADRRTGAPLLFVTTHLDHEGPQARREGANVLRDRLAALRGGAPGPGDEGSAGGTAGGSGGSGGGAAGDSGGGRGTDTGPTDVLPTVVCGDLNCTAGAEPYRVLAGTGERGSPLVDAREACPHPPHGPSTTRTDFESLLPDRQIDHVFVADCDVAGYGVAADLMGDGWFPSDHLPVVTDIAI